MRKKTTKTKKSKHLNEKSVEKESSRVKKVRCKKSISKSPKTDLTIVEKRKKPSKITDKHIVKLQLGITPQELAQKINQPVSKIITELMKLGIFISANQKLNDRDAIILVCSEFGYEVEFEDILHVEEKVQTEVATRTQVVEIPKKVVEKKHLEAIPPNYVKKIPVVTVMGHVDHGKTTLLDTIRNSNVAQKEFGAITQHIGAYKVKTLHGDITFIDTPGHEAFSAIRARGAKVTDIVVIVVAGDEGVMPQTIEAINHAKAADVPIIFAINKIDLPQCNANRVKQQLADMGFIPSEWGGNIEFVEISARNNINIDRLLDTIILQAELMNLYVPIDVQAEATIIETKLDRKRGYTATVIVSKGKLKIGDAFVCSNSYGKVRAIFNDKGEKIDEVLPGEPAEVLGFEVPTSAGDTLRVVKDEKEAREIFEEIQEKQKIEAAKVKRYLTIQDVISGKSNILSVVLKGDTQGSIEAIQKMLKSIIEELKNNPDLPELKIVHSSVGEITESDVLLATASNAVILGFNVRPNIQALKTAKHEGIEIRTYRIIYELVDDIKNILQRLEVKKQIEEFLGRAKVKKVFDIPKVGKVAGCVVEDGKIVRNAKVRILRDNVIISETKVSSLKHFKEDVKEIQQGYECGIGLENFQDIREGDVIECYQIVEK